MVRRTHARRLALTLAVLMPASAGFIAMGGPSSADVTAVKGSAYGYFSRISLFGGPAADRGPAPTVTLPPAGSATPITASAATGDARYGPGIFFTSGPITVSTQGTTGPTGSVKSSADITNTNTSGAEVFTASHVTSTCTASESGKSGTTTITNGTLRTDDGDATHPEVVVTVPTNPAPNTTFSGILRSVGDTFRYIFNEQILNPDGSITVNAGHQVAVGPTAVGDLFIGQVVCGVTAVASTTTTSTTVATTSTTAATTSTTAPATTSTTAPATTSTTAATTSTTAATTSTTAATTSTTAATTSTTAPATTTTTRPATTTTAPATTTTAPATTTSTTSATTSTLPSTTTTIGTGGTGSTCTQVVAARTQFNAQIDAVRASIVQGVPADQQGPILAQLDAVRAQGNAQLNQLLAAC